MIAAMIWPSAGDFKDIFFFFFEELTVVFPRVYIHASFYHATISPTNRYDIILLSNDEERKKKCRLAPPPCHDFFFLSLVTKAR